MGAKVNWRGSAPILAVILLGGCGVLAIGLSDATVLGRFIAFDLIVAVAIFTLYYSVATIRTAIDF